MTKTEQTVEKVAELWSGYLAAVDADGGATYDPTSCAFTFTMVLDGQTATLRGAERRLAFELPLATPVFEIAQRLLEFHYDDFESNA